MCYIRWPQTTRGPPSSSMHQPTSICFRSGSSTQRGTNTRVDILADRGRHSSIQATREGAESSSRGIVAHFGTLLLLKARPKILMLPDDTDAHISGLRTSVAHPEPISAELLPRCIRSDRRTIAEILNISFQSIQISITRPAASASQLSALASAPQRNILLAPVNRIQGP